MRRLFAPIGTLLERRVGLGIIFLTVIIPLVMIIFGVGLWKNNQTPVIISEVSAPTKVSDTDKTVTKLTGDSFVELYNTTDQTQDVKGWKLLVIKATGPQTATVAVTQTLSLSGNT